MQAALGVEQTPPAGCSDHFSSCGQDEKAAKRPLANSRAALALLRRGRGSDLGRPAASAGRSSSLPGLRDESRRSPRHGSGVGGVDLSESGLGGHVDRADVASAPILGDLLFVRLGVRSCGRGHGLVGLSLRLWSWLLDALLVLPARGAIVRSRSSQNVYSAATSCDARVTWSARTGLPYRRAIAAGAHKKRQEHSVDALAPSSAKPRRAVT